MKRKNRLIRAGAMLVILLLCAGLMTLLVFADGRPDTDGAKPADVLPDISERPEDPEGSAPDETPLPEPTPIIVGPGEPVPFIEDPDVPIIIIEPEPTDPPWYGGCPIPDDFIEFFTLGDMDLDGDISVRDAADILSYTQGIVKPNWTESKMVTVGDITGDRKLDAADAARVLYLSVHSEEPVMGVHQDIPVCKPVLYLYPTETTDVSVTIGDEDALTCVYPAYNGGWTVTAQPDGTLTGTNGREYYALYYEADVTLSDAGAEDGFVVARDDIPGFLEEKLALLGLSEREAEEMIVYWLPRMQQHEYVFVRFASAEAVEEAMPLEISPAPDTVIRVWMEWRGLDAPAEVPEQALRPAARDGFTAVEWGGTELP